MPVILIIIFALIGAALAVRSNVLLGLGAGAIIGYLAVAFQFLFATRGGQRSRHR